MDWNVALGGGAARSLAPPPRAHAAAVKHLEEVDRVAAAPEGETDNASPDNTPPQNAGNGRGAGLLCRLSRRVALRVTNL